MGEPMNILDTLNNLSKLVAAAANGTDTVIAKRGHPVARITAVTSAETRTAASAAEWLLANPPVLSAVRSPEQLDAQITGEREGWE